MAKPDLQKLLMKCFYGDIEHEEVFKKLEYLIDESRELGKIKKALKEVEFGCIDKQEKGWTVDGFVPNVLGEYVSDLKN